MKKDNPVPNVASFSRLSFCITLRYSLAFICLESCVLYVVSFSRLSFCINPSVFSNILIKKHIQEKLATLGTHDTGQIHVREYRRGNEERQSSFSRLFFCITPSVFSSIYLSCVLCTLCCQFLWIVPLGTHDTGQIHVREYRRGNEERQSRETGNIIEGVIKRTIQRNWQHRIHKT
jgi:hypothetical protein